jgi:hypothetical protein
MNSDFLALRNIVIIGTCFAILGYWLRGKIDEYRDIKRSEAFERKIKAEENIKVGLVPTPKLKNIKSSEIPKAKCN